MLLTQIKKCKPILPLLPNVLAVGVLFGGDDIVRYAVRKMKNKLRINSDSIKSAVQPEERKCIERSTPLKI